MTINKMKNKHEEVNIVKVEHGNALRQIQINFEEFPNLLLEKLENKKKLKTYKRSEIFNYELFHKKERERLIKRKSSNNDIVTLSSPPKSFHKNSLYITDSSKSSYSKYMTEILNENFINKSPISSNNISILRSPEYEKFLDSFKKKIESPIIHKSPVKNHYEEDNDDYSSLKDDEENIIRFTNKKSLYENSISSSTKKSIKNSSPVSLLSYHSRKSSSTSSSSIKNLDKDDTIQNYKKITSKSPVSSVKKIINLSRRSSINNTIKSSIASSFKSYGSSIANRSIDVKSINNRNLNIKNINKSIKTINSFKSEIIETVHRVSSANSNSSSSTISDDDEKRELLFKFQLLLNKYPKFVSKYSFNMNSDLKVMKNTYKLILKQISVNSKVDNLNTYLLVGFMGCEYFFGKIGFDMEGFSKQQITSMKTYESLLVELGEKEYTPYGMDKWCVEIRLAATLLFNAFWFIIAKSISKKTNFDILSLININNPDQSNNTETKEPNIIKINNDKYKTNRDVSSN